MPEHEDGHGLHDAVTRRYESLWWYLERQLMVLSYYRIRDSMHVSIAIPSIIMSPLTASHNYNVFRIA